MATTVAQLLQNLDAVRYNPSSIQRGVYATLDSINDGSKVVVDATNPLAFGLDAAACMTAAFCIENATNNRAQYPSVAQTWDDLYRHASDKDYLNRFSGPSRTTMSLLLSKDEVISRAIQTDNPNIKKLVIPRNTVFTVADTDFSMQYPIELRVMSHGGLQIVYDGDVTSPLQALVSNVVPVTEVSNSGMQWLKLDIAVNQFNVLSRQGALNAATGYKATIVLQDLYYYTRVYIEDSKGNWNEIRTTHSDQIYDILTPTAVLKVVDQTLTVEIPQIYTTTLSLNAGIRIDAYQTKGPLDMILNDYDFDRFKATFLAIDSADDNQYVAPLKTFHNIAVFSRDVVTGGNLGLTFEQFRDRIMKNATGSVTIPITNAQIEAELVDAGYSVVKNIDNITNRVFLATRSLPPPTVVDTNVVTGAACSIETLSLNFNDVTLLDSVIDNGERITITPDTLYRNQGGVIKFLSNQETDQILAQPIDTRAQTVTNGSFLYTPLHYVLDTTGDTFDSRPYYLDSPVVDAKSFVGENDTTLLQVGTDSYSLDRVPTGYRLRVVTVSNTDFQALSDSEVFAQMSFIPPGEKDYAYLLGSYYGKTDSGERVFDFMLDTRFDVDSLDQLVFNSFLMYGDEPKKTPTQLSTTFNILWATSAVMPDGYVAGQGGVDELLGAFQLPARIAGVTHETMSVTFGSALDTLWARSRSVIDSVPYKRWEVDVPWTYDADVYLPFPDGSTVQIVDGVATYNKVHSAGDFVLDDNGDKTYQYRIGDTMTDASGQPIPASTRGMTRQCDMLFIEGAYWFATEASTLTYRKAITTLLVSWLVNDFETMNEKLLEQTRLYFYPNSTMGNIDVMILDGLVTTIEAGQRFTLTLSVSETVDRNDELKAKLERTAIKTIQEQLSQPLVAHSLIVDALQDILGSDIKGLTLTMLGDAQNIAVATVMDDTTRLGIRKRLAALPDDTLVVQDDVTVDFIRHEIK
jgi:hypothetical protein